MQSVELMLKTGRTGKYDAAWRAFNSATEVVKKFKETKLLIFTNTRNHRNTLKALPLVEQAARSKRLKARVEGLESDFAEVSARR